MTQAELFDNAKACEEMMRRAPELHIRATYGKLFDMWIKLANDSVHMTPEILAIEIAAINEMQSKIHAVVQSKIDAINSENKAIGGATPI